MDPKIYKTKDGQKFKVRLATPDDYDESIMTFASVASEKLYLNTEEVAPDIKNVWTERWKDNGANHLFCVAEYHGKLTGGIVLNKYSKSPKTFHVLELGMWLLKEYRGDGMGSAMLEYVMNWARETPGIRKIVLGVWSTNIGALALYNKFGFHIEGCHRNIAKINGKYADEVLMAYDFENKE